MSLDVRDLPRTPVLAQRLADVRTRLVRAVLLHAFGSVVAVLCLWVAFAFLADYVLGVPHVVRWLHLGVLIALPLAAAWREGYRHLTRIPDGDGLAVLAERDSADGEELFVSAVQLQRREADESGTELEASLVGRVLERAEERARGFRPESVLDLQGPRRRAGLGLGAIAATALWLALLPSGYASIFGARLVGAATPWPQRTFLALELPIAGGSARVEADGELLRARVARGSDLPILVRAEGDVPDSVRLTFDDGRTIDLGSARGGMFRTELPALRASLAFSVTGGDDLDGLPRAEIEVLQPPDLAGLAFRVSPPAYSGLSPTLSVDRGTKALRGSRIELFARTTAGVEQAEVEFLPAVERRTLEARELPPELAEQWMSDATDADASLPVVGLEWIADSDVRLRFALVDGNGLGNPDPGLFAVDVVEDNAPELTVIAPGRANVESVQGGALALRARVRDDFGLTQLLLEVQSEGREADPLVIPLEGTALALDSEESGAAQRMHRLLEIDELLAGVAGDDAGSVDQLTLTLSALDNAEPPQRGVASRIRVRLLSVDELLRRVQDRLARARVEASDLFDLQRERRNRTEELLTSLGDDGALEPADARAVQSGLNGQRRVEAEAEALLRELAATAELVLYARLDDSGEELLQLLDSELRERVERVFDPEPWRRVSAAVAAGGTSDEGFASHIVRIVELGLVTSDRATAAAGELAAAEIAEGGASMGDALAAAIERQTETLSSIEDLLDRLAEWDNFQSVLALTRDILERQRAVRDRVQRLASDK